MIKRLSEDGMEHEGEDTDNILILDLGDREEREGVEEKSKGGEGEGEGEGGDIPPIESLLFSLLYFSSPCALPPSHLIYLRSHSIPHPLLLVLKMGWMAIGCSMLFCSIRL